MAEKKIEMINRYRLTASEPEFIAVSSEVRAIVRALLPKRERWHDYNKPRSLFLGPSPR